MNDFYSTDEIANIVGVKKKNVQQWIRSGQLTALKLGREYRIRKTVFEEFLKSKEVTTKKESSIIE